MGKLLGNVETRIMEKRFGKDAIAMKTSIDFSKFLKKRREFISMRKVFLTYIQEFHFNGPYQINC